MSSKNLMSSDIKNYSDNDYYHTMERFCKDKKILYLHCISRKPRFVENNDLKIFSSINFNCNYLLNGWVEYCKDFWK